MDFSFARTVAATWAPSPYSHFYSVFLFRSYCCYSDTGAKSGKGYSVNFPLNDGIDDLSYEHVFRPVIGKIMEM